MGLARDEPIYSDLIKNNLIEISKDGSFQLIFLILIMLRVLK